MGTKKVEQNWIYNQTITTVHCIDLTPTHLYIPEKFVLPIGPDDVKTHPLLPREKWEPMCIGGENKWLDTQII